jgi:hypothetical protein
MLVQAPAHPLPPLQHVIPQDTYIDMYMYQFKRASLFIIMLVRDRFLVFAPLFHMEDGHDSPAAAPRQHRSGHAQTTGDFAATVGATARHDTLRPGIHPFSRMQMFQEIIINRSLPNLRKLLSHLLSTGHNASDLLRTPDPSRDNATPFLLACLSGNQGICSYLLELGADFNAKSSRSHLPALSPHITSVFLTCLLQRQHGGSLCRPKR